MNNLHLLYLVSPHTLDFIVHSFCAGFAEMNAYLVGGLAHFLYQRWGILRLSDWGVGYGLRGTGFFVYDAPFSGRGYHPVKQSYYYGSSELFE